KQLSLDIAYYEKSLLSAQKENDSDKIELFHGYLSKTRLELVALRGQLEKEYPRYQAWKQGGKIISIADIQSKLLGDSTALIEYFVGDSSAFVFLISKDKAEILALDSPPEINLAIRAFREELLGSGKDLVINRPKLVFENYHQKASKVYEYIFESLTQYLSQELEKLIIVPDGLINTIPLEALTKKENLAPNNDFSKLPYLVYDYDFAYAYSADLWRKNQERKYQLPANTNCLALAPTYKGNDPGANQEYWRELKWAVSEIDSIKNFFTGYFDSTETATKNKFKKIAPEYGIIHLAMHGKADMDNSNFNLLVFSDVLNNSPEDHLLYHYEIANMDLEAQLVVLSACETGVGKYEKGEGVFSLARSFMYAGVPSVVMSLWNVDDASTSRMMSDFYKFLASGDSKSMSLTKAKRLFLEKSDSKNLHPFYWSAFVIVGDSGEIKSDHSSYLIWGGGILVLLGIIGWFGLRYRRKMVV
ncbi:MAG: CHAT domain-containing protein, partial [Bacteroidetes bacterium]|nr:CHAT domain-containing protein [Bacteroidota bacterium]